MLANVIPTRHFLFNCFEKGNSSCPFCGFEQETSIHVFKDCPFVRALTFSSVRGCRLDHWNIDSIHHLVEFCINPSGELLKIGIEKDLFS